MRHLDAGARIQVRPGSAVTVGGGSVRLPGDTTIVVGGGSTLSIDRGFLIPADDLAGRGGARANQAHPPLLRVPASAEITVHDRGTALTVTGVADIEMPKSGTPTSTEAMPTGAEITVHTGGATVAAAGVADIVVPRYAEVVAPGGTRTRYRSKVELKVPAGTNVIVADMRSIMPAAMATMFGIGAELGILGVLGWSLSAQAHTVRVAAIVVLAVTALLILGYAVAATRALGDATPGSALSGKGATSFTL